jgi:hypothetical protein
VGNTLSRNHAAYGGGGIASWSSSTPLVVNCILWENYPDQIHVYGGNPVVRYSDIEGGWPGAENIDADPLFVDAGRADFHLRLDSPCVDRGDNGASGLPPVDNEGDGRILDGDLDGFATVDLGGDELVFDVAVRFGTVNASTGPLSNVLLVNGSPGNGRRMIRLSSDVFFELSMNIPPRGPAPSPFALYAWNGMPDETSCTPHPENLGLTCFPTPLTGGTPQPLRIWNNIGKTQHLGDPHIVSEPAPSNVITLPDGVGRPMTVTFQGLILDDGSAATKPASVTNGVVVEVE